MCIRIVACSHDITIAGVVVCLHATPPVHWSVSIMRCGFVVSCRSPAGFEHGVGTVLDHGES